jgi:glyoxylase-like metal-dependent hydrolase (beta-lactamase superfamily II)
MPEKVKIRTIDLGFVNVYLLKTTDGFVLIDTGMTRQWEKLKTALRSAGCLPGTLKLVITTHGDFDHTGNCAKLQKEYGTKIAIHPADSYMAEKGVMAKRTITTLMGKIMVIFFGLMSGKTPFPRFKPDLLLADGQDLSEYGLDAKIIHIPGHTKGSIGILTDEGDFFIGDTLNYRKKPLLSPFVEDMPALRQSMEMLKTLLIRTVYPGHGKSFSGEEIRQVSL